MQSELRPLNSNPLREGSDRRRSLLDCQQRGFNPRSPGRERKLSACGESLSVGFDGGRGTSEWPGIHATREEMYTTALATIDYIREHYPAAKRLFLLGTPSMISEFEAAGFESAADSADDVPDVVVAAFDMTLQYDRLCRAAWWVSQGVPYIATNPDRVCPTDQPTVLVDCGSICACIEHATGRRPDITLGKPDPNMLSGILSRHGLQPDQIAMVGDRIYTDVAMAHNAKAMGVLVLSGETTLDVADKADPQPHITADSIEVLGALIREAHSK